MTVGAVTPAQQVLVPSLFDGSLHPGPEGGKGEPANMAPRGERHRPPARGSGNGWPLWGDLEWASQGPRGEAHWSPVAACDAQGPSWPHPRDALRRPGPSSGREAAQPIARGQTSGNLREALSASKENCSRTATSSLPATCSGVRVTGSGGPTSCPSTWNAGAP